MVAFYNLGVMAGRLIACTTSTCESYASMATGGVNP